MIAKGFLGLVVVGRFAINYSAFRGFITVIVLRQRLEKEAFSEDFWDSRVLPESIIQDVLSENKLAILIDDVALQIYEVA